MEKIIKTGWLILGAAVVLACGGGGGGLASGGQNLPFDEEIGATILPEGAMAFVGVAPKGMNPINLPIKVRLKEGEFFPNASEFKLVVNGTIVPGGALSISKNEVSSNLTLADGKNTISFKGYDKSRRVLHLNQTLWAGNQTLAIQAVDEGGNPVQQSTVVTLRLADDGSIVQQKTTTTGSATFQNVPNRTVVVEAKSGASGYGVGGGVGSAGTLTIKVASIGNASAIKNNDFSKGMTGWTIDGSSGSIINHVEGFPPIKGQPARNGEQLQRNATNSHRVSWTPNAPNADDNDLMVATQGEGPQNATRTFQTSAGTNAVKVRFRFITSEVPGGWFGSQYNDYFQVALRTSSGFAGESNSMNGLGLAAFDFGSGATEWRTVTLKTNPAGDTVRFDAQVANVGDGAFDSQVVIDYISEEQDSVTPSLTWNPQTGGLRLTYTVDKTLTNAVMIQVHWASGSTYASRLGASFFTQNVAAGTGPGSYGPFPITGQILANNPAGTEFIIAAASESRIGSVADVSVGFGPQADASVVSATMLDIVEDGLRQAGQASATIFSTARTPFDQARAMFQNLVNPAFTIAQNIATQKGLYAAPGDQVVDVFAAAAQGLTLAQINAQATTIRASMEAKINELGPTTVSKHCADPAVISVVDVGKGAFAANGNGNLFLQAVTGRLSSAPFDETTNNCYHLERD